MKKLNGTLALYGAIAKAKLPANLKVILWALASFRGKRGLMYPSINMIAERAGLSRKQVFRTVDLLLDLEIIRIVDTISGAKSNHYEIDLNQLSTMEIRRTCEPLLPWHYNAQSNPMDKKDA